MAPLSRLHTCPKCRALLDPTVKECPYCQTSMRHVAAPTVEQDAARTTNIFIWILVANVFLYVAMVALDRHRSDETQSSLMGEPSSQVLRAFGANVTGDPRAEKQYWRQVTSMFLHLNLVHLGFNTVALFIVGALAAQTLGADRAWVIYVLSGIVGSLMSQLTHHGGISAGASGALCGMIGALFFYGKRRGGHLGRQLASRMLFWTVFIFAFGMMPGVDNWGHLGGLLGGLALGWLAAGLTARGGREDRLWRAFGAVALIVVLISFVFAGIEVGRYLNT